MAIVNKFERMYEIRYLTSIREYRSFIKENADVMTKYDWYLISKGNLSEPFMKEHFDKLDWQYICSFKKLSLSFIGKYLEKLDVYAVSKFQKLTHEFIVKNAKKLSMPEILRNDSIMDTKDFPEIEAIYEKLAKDEKYVKLWDEFADKSMYKKRKEIVQFSGNKQNNKTESAVEVIPEIVGKSIKPKKKILDKYYKKDLDLMKKKELQDILDHNRVGYYYKNTIPELVEKILSRQKRKNYNMADLEGLKKDVLLEILIERGVETLSTDTVEILKGKVLKSK